MTYYFSDTVKMRFDDVVASTKEALKRHNFRVLTEIDMKDNFKNGLNVDFRPYLSSRMRSTTHLSSASGGRQGWNNVTLQHRSAAARGRSC